MDKWRRTHLTTGKPSEFYYTAFGLTFQSNFSIAGLRTASSPIKSPDVKMVVGSLPALGAVMGKVALRYESTSHNEAGEPDVRISEINHGAFLRLCYCDGSEFWFDRQLSTLWAAWSAKSSLENTLTYLVGPVLGLLLRMRGVVCLHASAVAMDGRALVFVGPQGAGKSTTAAGFARQKFAVISDDIAALREEESTFQILPAYPRVNLWPKSVSLLYGSPEVLPRIMPNWGKRYLALGCDQASEYQENALPLGAVYIFGSPVAPFETCIESVSRKTGLLSLLSNTYAANFGNSRQTAKDFDVLSRVVAAVPIRKIMVQRSVSIDQLCLAIRRDFDAELSRSV